MSDEEWETFKRQLREVVEYTTDPSGELSKVLVRWDIIKEGEFE